MRIDETGRHIITDAAPVHEVNTLPGETLPHALGRLLDALGVGCTALSSYNIKHRVVRADPLPGQARRVFMPSHAEQPACDFDLVMILRSKGG